MTGRAKGSAQAKVTFSSACAQADVKCVNGKGAVARTYAGSVSVARGCTHSHSCDFDEAHRKMFPNDPRWDYGLGVVNGTSEVAIWIEAHPASSTGEAASILKKAEWRRARLNEPQYSELKTLTTNAQSKKLRTYVWLACTGAIKVLPGSKEGRKIAACGIHGPVRQVCLSA